MLETTGINHISVFVGLIVENNAPPNDQKTPKAEPRS